MLSFWPGGAVENKLLLHLWRRKPRNFGDRSSSRIGRLD